MRLLEKLGIRGTVLALAVAAVAIGVTMAGLVLVQVIRVARLEREAARLDDVLPRVRTIGRLVADLETGQRGFVVTGDPSVLEPYTAAIHDLPRVIGQARTLLAGDPLGLAQLARVEALVLQSIGARRAGARTAPGGMSTMEQLRAGVSELDHRYYIAHVDLRREVDVAVRQLVVTIPVATALGGFLVLVIGAWTAHALRRRLDEVAEQGERMADGEIEVPAAIRARNEVGRLLRTLATLGLSLKAQAAETAAAQRRVALLAQATHRLGASLDVEPTLNEVAELAVPSLGDGCIVDLLDDDGRIRRVAIAHADPATRPLALQMLEHAPDPAGPHPVAVAIRTGRSQMGTLRLGSPTDAFFTTAAHLDLVRRIGTRAFMVVPLVARGRTMGAVSFVYAGSGRCYEPADLALAEELARRAAVAIDNARLYGEARLARHEAQQQADFTSALTSSLGEGVLALDLEGRITFANRAATETLGWATGELVGERIDATVHRPHDGPSGPCVLLEGLEAGRITRHDEDAFVARSGERIPVSVTASPVVGQGRVTGAVVVFRDVSQRLALEQRMREIHKMEAVGQLAGGIAHDFNNILTAILGYSELLGKRAGADDRLARGLDEIRNSAQRAAGLTRQLLAFGRKQRLAPAVVDLEESLGRLAPSLARVVGEQVRVEVRHAPGLGRVKVDPALLDEALTRLAMNARDAMPQGGRFIVETDNAVLDAAYAAQHVDARPGAYVRITVRDTGPGMDARTLAHAFEPFYTTKEVGKGSGLGLAMVHGFVAQSGGHVAVESAPGAGAAFRIYLPRADEPAKPPATTAPARPRGSARETILLVDDEEALRSVARVVLEEHGYEVLVAHDGRHALSVAAAHRGSIALLLTDAVMPGMNGRELAERLSTARPGIGVLYMSGYSADVLDETGRLAAGSAFLEKPFTPDGLLRKVAATLETTARV